MSSSQPVCSHYLRGSCNNLLGDSCQLLHLKQPSHYDLPSKSPKAFGPCKFFIEGRCTKGKACPFSHVPSVARGSSIIVKDPQYPALGPCKFFAQGKCFKGEACAFIHLKDTRRTVPIPCSFFLQGFCRNGQNCPFTHNHQPHIPETSFSENKYTLNSIENMKRTTGLVAEEYPSQSIISDSGREIPGHALDSDTFERNMLYCKVVFGSGASVQSIITSFESRSVLLSHLPSTATQSELINLLEPFGDLESIVIDASSNSARAKFLSVSQASAAVLGLRKSQVRFPQLFIKMDSKAVESGESILKSTKVKVSWYAPNRVAWAHYKSISGARAQAKRLNGNWFNGRTVVATFQPPSLRQTTSFSVELKGLPTEVDPHHLRNFCQTQSVTIKELFYDRPSSIQDVQDLLRKYGSLDAFEALPPDQNKPKITAFAQFTDIDDAAEAVRHLHNKPQSFLHHTPIWLENIHSIKYSIPFLQYTSIRVPLTQLQDLCKDCTLRFYDRDELGREVKEVCIRVFGSDPKALGRVKSALEALLRGEEFIDEEGKVKWDDYFVSDAGNDFLLQVGQQTQTFVKSDLRTRTLRVYGDRINVSSAMQSLREKIQRLEAENHIISLDKAMIKTLMKGGYGYLCQLVGIENLTLDIVARTLVVRTKDFELGQVRVFLAVKGEHFDHVTSGVVCPVCYCDVTDPIRLPCNHLYCTDCLRHLLLAAAVSTSPNLRCIYQDDDMSCSASIPNRIIRSFLSPDQEAHLYEASFLSNIHARPSEFKYCPTPDCRVVYQPSEAVLRCPSCFDRICAACHVQFHEGLTCAEYRSNLTNGDDDFKKWKMENGVRPCPECKTDLQKAGGCNHMHCTQCGTHICWVCMKTFGDADQSGGVYHHMRKVHGSVF